MINYTSIIIFTGGMLITIFTAISGIMLLNWFRVRSLMRNLVQKRYGFKNHFPVLVIGDYGNDSMSFLCQQVIQSQKPDFFFKIIELNQGLHNFFNEYLTGSSSQQVMVISISHDDFKSLSKVDINRLFRAIGIIHPHSVIFTQGEESEFFNEICSRILLELPRQCQVIVNFDDEYLKQLYYTPSLRLSRVSAYLPQFAEWKPSKYIFQGMNGSEGEIEYGSSKIHFSTLLPSFDGLRYILMALAFAHTHNLKIAKVVETLREIETIPGSIGTYQVNETYVADNSFSHTLNQSLNGIELMKETGRGVIAIVSGENLDFLQNATKTHRYCQALVSLAPKLIVIIGKGKSKTLFKCLKEAGIEQYNILYEAKNTLQSIGIRIKKELATSDSILFFDGKGSEQVLQMIV